MDTEKILIIFVLLINSIDNYEVLMYYINKLRNNAQTKAAWQDLYISAMKDYTIGISVVKKRGVPILQII